MDLAAKGGGRNLLSFIEYLESSQIIIITGLILISPKVEIGQILKMVGVLRLFDLRSLTGQLV